MKHRFWSILTVSLVVFIFSTFVFAQNGRNERAATAASSMYVISAKAGAVNFVSGDVKFVRNAYKSANLMKGDELEVGDKVSTGANGKAEVLLNPGSFLRIAENSGFEFVTTSLDDLKLKLTGGSSVFEVIADKQFKVTVDTGKSRFYLIQSGVYRVDVLPDGSGKISVWKGKAQVGNINATTVKGGKTASITDGQVVVAKFDRNNKNDLDIWSKERSKEIAKINEKLIQREMNRSLLNSFSRTGSNTFGGYGLWVFDASYSGYCFLPFGYGTSSPYGYTYNQSIWNYSAPATIFYNTNPNITNPNNQNSNMNSPMIQTPTIQMPSSNAGSSNNGGSYTPPPADRSAPSSDSQVTRPTIENRRGEPKID